MIGGTRRPTSRIRRPDRLESGPSPRALERRRPFVREPNRFAAGPPRGRYATDAVWDRHSNPKSEWTRLLAYPVLIAAGFARRWRLVALTGLFLLVNPLLFPEPESTSDNWMSIVVRAERQGASGETRFSGSASRRC
ncbi:DUF6653 family protein [Natrinema amylolyticum]|uniref:DUF6653 family protein n=1 Tax=Natrinema amylolyticum TaxID=2878679 RepID=UPI003CCDB5B0